MSVYNFSSKQFLQTDIKTAWDFFSSPQNLSKITPPDLGFVILSPKNVGDMTEGMKIDYTVKPMFGITVHWRTLITDVVKHRYFTDKQLKGPYSIWEHTHTFNEQDGGILMTDNIRYKLPFGWLGIATHRLFVRKRIEEIFSYRTVVLDNLFNTKHE